MPAVVWGALGFVAGDLAGLLRPGPLAWGLALGLAALAVPAWRRPRGAAWAVVLTAGAAGAIWGAAAALREARDCRGGWREGERLALVVELWDLARAGGASRATVTWPAACRGPITVRWPATSRAALPSGAAVLVGTWHRSAARIASSWPARAARAGRLAVQRSRPLAAPVGARAALRLSAERRIVRLYGERRAPLAIALTTGAGDQLDNEVHRRFARAGIAHILAISGLHVGILAAAVLLVLRAARVRPAPARLVGTALVAAYVWMLGLPAPALRAFGLLALWCVARARSRPLVPNAALAVTALAVVVLDPFAAVEPGPWLSFAGAWGCGQAARHWARERRGRRRRPRALEEPLAVAAVSGGATLATAPFSILAFGTMAPAALVANPLAIPLAGVLMPALALSLALGALAPGVAALPAASAVVGLDALDRIASLAGSLPLASLPLERRAASAAVAAVVAALVLRPRSRVPSPSRRAPRGATFARRFAAAAGIVAAAWAWWPLLPADPGGASRDRGVALALHFLAVGQGDAAAIRTPHGHWIVVDGGPRNPFFDAGASVVVPFLQRSGVRTLDLVIASHGEADHAGGLPAVVRRFRPGLVLEPGAPLASPLYRRFLAAVAQGGGRWRPARAGDTLTVDGVALRVLHPDSAFLERGLPANEGSVVVALEYGAFRAILAGDAGLRAEAAPALAAAPRATLLKVGHHGSRTATGPAFLAALAPAVCVISVGPNRFGQPDAAVLGDLARAGCGVFRTDAGGGVTVETDGRTVRVGAADRDTSFSLTREQQ